MLTTFLCARCFAKIDVDERLKKFKTFGEKWSNFLEALV